MSHSRSTGQASHSTLSPGRFRSEVKQHILFKLLVTLIQRYPLLFWSGIWMFLILVTWVGATALIRIDPLEAEKPQPEVTVAASPSRLPAKPASSFGLLVAIAVSCGATSFLLARQLNGPQPQRRVITKTKSPSAPVKQTAIAPQMTVVAAQGPTKPAATNSRSVTVVPPEESHPLDWGNASLAEMMDIRKQHSISSLR